MDSVLPFCPQQEWMGPALPSCSQYVQLESPGSGLILPVGHFTQNSPSRLYPGLQITAEQSDGDIYNRHNCFVSVKMFVKDLDRSVKDLSGNLNFVLSLLCIKLTASGIGILVLFLQVPVLTCAVIVSWQVDTSGVVGTVQLSCETFILI